MPGPRNHVGTLARLAASCAVALSLWSSLAAADGPASEPPAPAPVPARPSATPARVRLVEFEGEIEPALAAYLKRAIARAIEDNVSGIVFAIDSPGGRLDAAIEIVDAILAVPPSIRTTAWIDHEAISAAAFAALACDEIVMSPTATLGDCQPILPGADGGFTRGGEKIETYLRAQFRRLAKAKGWDPLLAEKFVTMEGEVVEVRVRDARPEGANRLFVGGKEFDSARDADLVAGHPKRDLERVAVVVPDGRLLTLTAAEAKHLRFVTRTYPDAKGFEASLRAAGAVVERIEMSTSERAARWLLGLAGVLGGIVLLCVVLSVYQGIGTPTIVGVAALALLGLVTATADLSNGFAWFLAGAGVLLLLTEAFLLPGTAIPGLLGIVAMATGLLFLVTGTTAESRGALSWETARSFLLQSILAMGATAAFFFALTRLFPRLPFGGRALVVNAQGLAPFGPHVPLAPAVATGRRGRAATDLRPAGRADFAPEGALAPEAADVVSEGGFVEAGTPVEIVRVEGTRVVVRPVTPAGSPGATP